MASSNKRRKLISRFCKAKGIQLTTSTRPVITNLTKTQVRDSILQETKNICCWCGNHAEYTAFYMTGGRMRKTRASLQAAWCGICDSTRYIELPNKFVPWFRNYGL